MFFICVTFLIFSKLFHFIGVQYVMHMWATKKYSQHLCLVFPLAKIPDTAAEELKAYCKKYVTTVRKHNAFNAAGM